jgi:hypothetical protein
LKKLLTAEKERVMKKILLIFLLGFILHFLFGIILLVLNDPEPKWGERQTNARLGIYKAALNYYKLNHGSYPKQFKDLWVLPPGMDKETWQGPYLEDPYDPYLEDEESWSDGWKQPFKYETFDNGQNCKITSAGKDRMFGTSDDIYTIYGD